MEGKPLIKVMKDSIEVDEKNSVEELREEGKK